MPLRMIRKLSTWVKQDYRRLLESTRANTGARALNLGCGSRPMPGFLNVDLVAGSGVDQVVDLEQPLPFDDMSFDLVVADNVFEHIRNYLALLQECSRILRPGGTLVVDVPYFRSAGAFIDPTHCNYFTLRSMRYFVPDTYESRHYRYLPLLFSSVQVVVDPHRQRIGSAWTSLIANKRPEWIEGTVLAALLPIASVRFVLQK
ncbi:hypothetical protein CKO43_13630 [Rubrivivax gelatinosus]|uniref:Methyltransferase type 11 domain-containing protein n=2 Tax=Rubrivivax gelatinosus TaxID=28068 RepID=A0ABS1DVR6_RUBGE|nr:hypothetical protein [Rubrivivax gelatinosus]